jgi:hypothetical protein
MISDAISDLHDHLQEMEDRLKELQVRGEPHRVNNPAEEREVQEEKESIERCLEICSQVSNYIANIEPSLLCRIRQYIEGGLIIRHMKQIWSYLVDLLL